MIGAPLNDAACLGQLTAIASAGTARAEVQALAARFSDTEALATWIRGLPQRDDTGRKDDGPRVMCDVGQRARLLADDPNCVERAILYLSASELIDPEPVRQLATVDVSATLRHTFPIEDGDPVVLDPEVRRNALRAGVWALRNGADEGSRALLEPVDAGVLLYWLLDLAEDAAVEDAGEHGLRRVLGARRAVDVLLRERRIHPRARADLLYALRLAGEVAPWFGDMGREGYRVARVLVARLVTLRTVGARRRNLSTERVVYWGGKAVATFYGVGGLYDAAYAEVRRRPGQRRREPTKAPPYQTATPPAVLDTKESAVPSQEPTDAVPAPVLGTLGELDSKGE